VSGFAFVPFFGIREADKSITIKCLPDTTEAHFVALTVNSNPMETHVFGIKQPVCPVILNEIGTLYVEI